VCADAKDEAEVSWLASQNAVFYIEKEDRNFSFEIWQLSGGKRQLTGTSARASDSDKRGLMTRNVVDANNAAIKLGTVMFEIRSVNTVHCELHKATGLHLGNRHGVMQVYIECFWNRQLIMSTKDEPKQITYQKFSFAATAKLNAAIAGQ
jgi:hypothetical protein